MPGAPVPARLHAILARDSSRAVVLRKGPTNAVCTILWDRTTDQFTLGQWLRGRIYERRCDLSPDGRYMIYFARGGGLKSPTKGSWTAISRAPWLRAISLYGNGSTWLGGGLFLTNDTFWLNGAGMHFPLDQAPEVREVPDYVPQGAKGGECLSVYYPRLLRDGWTLSAKVSEVLSDSCDAFEKQLAGGWILRKFAHAQVGPGQGKGVYWDEHELEHPRFGILLSKSKWEWAERDGESVVWAEGGCLYRAKMAPEGFTDAILLYDTNPLQFERIQAP